MKDIEINEMEIYQKNFTDGIPTMKAEMNQDNLPSKQTIINAMKKAQKAVEDIRNNKEEVKIKKENKKDEGNKKEGEKGIQNNSSQYHLWCNMFPNSCIGYDDEGVWHCFT